MFTKISKTLHFPLKSVLFPFHHDWNKSFQKSFNVIWTITTYFSLIFSKHIKGKDGHSSDLFEILEFLEFFVFLFVYEKLKFHKSIISPSKDSIFVISGTLEEWGSCDSRHQQRRWCQENVSRGFFHPWMLGKF